MKPATLAALPSQLPLMVEVFCAGGGEAPLITAAQGRIGTECLAAIEQALVEDPFFADGKARGTYLCRPQYEAGQYDHEGRCELAPGWGIDGADRIADHPLDVVLYPEALYDVEDP
jgi:hypothetical protein